MLKHYVKVALRLIKRSFLFSSINMLGFVLGMTAAFLIYLWIVDESAFEDFQINRDSIYRIIAVEQEASGQVKKSAYTGRIPTGGECYFYVEFRNFEPAFGHRSDRSCL